MKTMKTTNIFRCLGIALAGLALSSCAGSLDSPESNGTEKNDTFLKLDISMPSTRGVVEGTSFQQGDEVYVIAYLPGKAETYNASSKATWNGDEWIFENPIDLAGKTPQGNDWVDGIEVAAFYPYSEIVGKDIVIRDSEVYVYDFYMPDYNHDVLTGSDKSIGKDNSTAKIKFDHAFTRLTINLQNETSEELNVNNFVLKNDVNMLEQEYGGWISEFVNIAPYGAMHDTYRDANVWKSNFEEKLPYGQTIANGGAYKLDILMAPTIDRYKYLLEKSLENNFEMGGLNLTFDVNGKPVSLNIPAKSWNAGEQCVYNVKLNSRQETNGQKVECLITQGDEQLLKPITSQLIPIGDHHYILENAFNSGYPINFYFNPDEFDENGWTKFYYEESEYFKHTYADWSDAEFYCLSNPQGTWQVETDDDVYIEVKEIYFNVQYESGYIGIQKNIVNNNIQYFFRDYINIYTPTGWYNWATISFYFKDEDNNDSDIYVTLDETDITPWEETTMPSPEVITK